VEIFSTQATALDEEYEHTATKKNDIIPEGLDKTIILKDLITAMNNDNLLEDRNTNENLKQSLKNAFGTADSDEGIAFRSACNKQLQSLKRGDVITSIEFHGNEIEKAVKIDSDVEIKEINNLAEIILNIGDYWD
jgi:adenylate kinase family enzyme